MDRQKISQELKKDNTKQPVTCPWVANQPYPSSLSSKNRNGGQKRNSNSQTNNCINNHWEPSSSQNGCSQHNENSTFSSMQQSSNQFFLFLRLMQLFPHTHPATLHSVLYICKNDFFCAIDKLLYAKRCKILYNNRRNQIHHQKTEKFTIINQNHIADPPVKRQFSKSADDENESDREPKIAKINEQDIQIDKQEIINSDGVKLCEKRSGIETPVDPVGTIKFITIKTNNIQEKQNISALENVDLKFDQVIL
ncbi:uncharacterized protein LOC123674644 [Harmonia axyridis]|uniref:uncharacterized protein LOC123674644 n=1 Tax=Harmonia axyridis TaxID=115357 RepID=UPI001E2778B5|nr:uncharacterized protein LOC123674644 [Harmonia axyridis]